MKKIAIFAAVAATCFGAAAQSTVNVYGRVNTTLENQNAGGTKTTALQNNASRIGFKGSEDMGGGLKTNFVLEAGFSGVDGKAQTNLFGRQASLEIAGGFGAVRLGNWTPGSYFATADYVSNHNHDTGSSSDALYGFDTFVRASKVGYFTPNMSGFSGEASTTVNTAAGAVKTYDLSGNYDAGAAHLGLGYSKQAKLSQLGLRGLYEMGPLTVGGYVQRVTSDGSVNGSNRTALRLSGMYTMGASEFHLNFGNTTKGAEFADKANQATIGYNYNLSKRTKAYGFYTTGKKDGQGVTGVAGQDFSSLAVGVRHNF
jgi:predicted porin